MIHYRRIYQRGITTLTLLILLSSLLMILMLLNDDILRLHSVLVTQKTIYTEQSFRLQQNVKRQQEDVCETIPLQSSEMSRVISFEHKKFDDSTRHFIWCQRQSLFKQAPKIGVNERKFTAFIQHEHLPMFIADLSAPPIVLPNDRGNYFYWFGKHQTEWILSGNIYAVVVAEGDLNISGKGRISGAVITGGTLNKGENVQLYYRKSTVTDIVQNYSRWQRVMRSWHDFTSE